MAGLQTLIQALAIEKKVSKAKKKSLVKVLENKISEIDFRMQLLLNFLLAKKDKKKLYLEFFDLANLVSLSVKEFDCELKLAPSEIEILSDRNLLSQVLDYLARLSSLKSKNSSFTLTLVREGQFILLNYEVAAKKEAAKFDTDLELEERMLKMVIKNFSSSLKSDLLERKTGKKTLYQYRLPLKFIP